MTTHQTMVITKEIRVAAVMESPSASQFKMSSSPVTKGMQLPIYPKA